MRHYSLLCACAFLFAPYNGCFAGSPTEPHDRGQLTIDRIYASDEFDAKSISPKWLPKTEGKGAAYTLVESTADSDDSGKGIVLYDAQTGERQVMVRHTDLIPPGESKPLVVEDYQFSSDLGRVLIFTNSVRVWRANTRGDYWVFDRGSRQLRKLGGAAQPSTLMYAAFSPQGNSVAYVHENDLCLQDLIDGTIRRLVFSDNPHLISGATDWVYEEEFGLRKGFHWSPDGRQIAFWMFDTSTVQEFRMINNTDSIYPEIIRFPYPKAGTRNAIVKVGTVDVQSGRTSFIDLPGEPQESYLPRMQWLDRTGQLIVRQMNRLQNRETAYLVDAASGQWSKLFEETDEAWIDLQDTLPITDDGKALVYQSDRNGWRALYRVDLDQGSSALIAGTEFDTTEVVSVGNQVVYFIASPDSATERFLYRSSINGSDVSRVTPVNASGVHEYDISPDGKYAVHRWSTTETPSQTELVSLPEHRTIRVLEDNEKLTKAFRALDRSPVEFFQVDIGKAMLDGWCIKPPEFDPSEKYPLLVYVYGEPAGSTVMNQFGGQVGLWHQYLAQRGYVVVSIDNRGTDVPRGRAFRKSVYRKLGALGPDDQAAAVKQLLKDRPYLDPSRVGSWGWSGGGTSSLHAIFRYPDLYKTAVAVAPVANLRYYDTIYEERYMGLPSDNVDGYHRGSPIHFAENLKGDLLVVHGTADDNVHYQCTELLINELVAKNRMFELFVYPGRTHSIRERENTRRHLMTTITRFLERTL